jgi:DNA-binding NtrC family response regulator
MTKPAETGPPIVVIDDEIPILLAMDTILQMANLNRVITCSDSRQAIDILNQHGACVVLLDLNMPHMDGQTLMPEIMDRFPEVPIIIITGSIDVETAVRAMKTGAFDYIVKPVDESRLVTAVHQALRFNKLQRENNALRKHLNNGGGLQHPEVFKDIVTQSPKMRNLFQYIESIAPTEESVLIRGETGVGKELVARAIHALSTREGEFVAINVAGLDDNIFSDTLFGHVKGAFTGADADRKGLIEKANGGTLFLDEIGDLNHGAQVKLLRLLQEHEYMPLGKDSSRMSDARIIASTHADLWAMQENKQFRKDLHYRLRTHRVWIPPLRERNEDLALLCKYFLVQAANALDKPRPEITTKLLSLLATYPFPGNIRELKAMVFDAMAQHKSGPLPIRVFQDHMSRAQATGRMKIQNFWSDPSAPNTGADLPTIKEATRQLVKAAMHRCDDNQSQAAQILGISQQALSKRLKNMSMESK